MVNILFGRYRKTQRLKTAVMGAFKTQILQGGVLDMTRLFSAADRYLEVCSWKDIALLKFCLCAIGVLVGIALPARRKRAAAWLASTVLVITYIPLMIKFIPCLFNNRIEDLYE